jgi:hypothetical protein
MPLDQDTTLGACYASVAQFTTMAGGLGCGVGLAAINDPGDLAITAILAAASRVVDAFCGREFDLQTIQEDQKWDLLTRRVYPYQPPVANLLSYQIQTAPGSYQNITLTPTTVDASGATVSYGAIVYDKSRNYLELASLAVLTSLTPVLVSLGISEPIVRYQYTSFANVPQQVITATSLIAAEMVNKAYRNKRIVPGLQSISSGKQTITSAQFQTLSKGFIMPPEAEIHLRRFQSFWIA